MQKQIKCPRCEKLTVYSTENSFRPFCSERCQLIDLGEWASNKYAIPLADPLINDDDAEKELSQEESADAPQLEKKESED